MLNQSSIWVFQETDKHHQFQTPSTSQRMGSRNGFLLCLTDLLLPAEHVTVWLKSFIWICFHPGRQTVNSLQPVLIQMFGSNELWQHVYHTSPHGVSHPHSLQDQQTIPLPRRWLKQNRPRSHTACYKSHQFIKFADVKDPKCLKTYHSVYRNEVGIHGDDPEVDFKRKKTQHSILIITWGQSENTANEGTTSLCRKEGTTWLKSSATWALPPSIRSKSKRWSHSATQEAMKLLSFHFPLQQAPHRFVEGGLQNVFIS